MPTQTLPDPIGWFLTHIGWLFYKVVDINSLSKFPKCCQFEKRNDKGEMQTFTYQQLVDRKIIIENEKPIRWAPYKVPSSSSSSSPLSNQTAPSTPTLPTGRVTTFSSSSLSSSQQPPFKKQKTAGPSRSYGAEITPPQTDKVYTHFLDGENEVDPPRLGEVFIYDSWVRYRVPKRAYGKKSTFRIKRNFREAGKTRAITNT